METSPLEELLLEIHKLQSIMIDVATGKADFEDAKESYLEIYGAVEVAIELLQEDSIPVWNPNKFTTLQSWRDCWLSELSTYALRRQYIRELYIDLIIFIEDILQKRASEISINKLLTVLEPNHLKSFLSEIQQLQSILTAVAGERDIDVEEANYVELYQKLLTSIRNLQQVGLPLKNPNNFSSLWHWQNYWLYELDGYASRQQFVSELYVGLVKPIQKALQKYQQRSTSIEEFTVDLHRRFNEQILEQPLNFIPTNSIVIEKRTNTKTNAMPLESTKALEVDSTRAIALQPSPSSFTEPMIDFAIITAIKTERLAVLNAFEIDEKKDREHKGSRTYWRKRLFLQDGKFYEIVVAQSLDMANVNAAILANDTLHHWKPAAVLMVGIAATAKPETKQQVGNLVIGKEVYYYETGKVTVDGRLLEPKYLPVDATLLDRVQALPDSDFSILVDRPDGNHTRPKIELGVIASGDKVIADATERDAIAAVNRKIMAIEMEGYGVISAAWQSFDQVRCLVIRALCDYADSNKHDQWHPYAAAVAAGFAKHFLMDEPLVPRDSPNEAN